MAGYVGTRCQICTGCGRCMGRTEGIRVITDSFVMPEIISTEQGTGAFVTADIGTTTIAMECYDGAGRKLGQYVQTNPQRVFGPDVISRIQAAEQPYMAKQMQRAVKRVIEDGIHSFQGEFSGITIAANTTMNYLLAGIDPAELGRAPFAASHLESLSMELDGLPAVTLPGISAFVGGDILAGILACGIHRQAGPVLLIDLGTNGELVLGGHDRLLACSTAAGPAFEGGGSSGQSGVPVWGADMIKLTAELLRRGIIDETGLLQEPYFESGIPIGGVHITQEGIRSLQTAKAAISAGIRVLVREYGLRDAGEIRQVYLAGGFGYFLDPEAAATIGLLPAELSGKVKAVGNSALAGAYYYRRCKSASGEAEHIREITETRNLAEADSFSKSFIENMYLRKN